MTTFGPDSDWGHLYIDGTERAACDRESIHVKSPANRTGFADVPAATADDVDQSYRAAVEAQNAWKNRLPQERAGVIESAIDLLEANSAEFAELVRIEGGGTHGKAAFEVKENAPGMMEEAATFPTRMGGDAPPSTVANRENIVRREPVGVIAVISPWNFPFHLSMRAVAPAIAVGNTVVLKPSEETPISGGLALARLFEAAGLPPGVLNVVPGWGDEAGKAVASHPDADVVSFTGSSAVGREVASNAGANLALPALELGGNNPHVVVEDADIEGAVNAATFGSFFHQGQICLSINRHLVHESVAEEYTDQLATRAKELVVGDGTEADIGPVINARQRDEMLGYVADSVDAGAEVVAGGGHDELYVEPTVLRGVENDMAVSCNEHFGPIAPVITFSDDEEAIRLANDTEYGLSASVHATDLTRARRIGEEIDAGMVHVNDQPVNGEPHIPFGGVKASGLGRYNGEAVMREFTRECWLSIQHEPRDYPL